MPFFSKQDIKKYPKEIAQNNWLWLRQNVAKMTAHQLAPIFKCKPATIYHWEQGYNPVPLSYADIIVDLFTNLTIKDFYTVDIRDRTNIKYSNHAGASNYPGTHKHYYDDLVSDSNSILYDGLLNRLLSIPNMLIINQFVTSNYTEKKFFDTLKVDNFDALRRKQVIVQLIHIYRLLEAYPFISLHWLLFGFGSPYDHVIYNHIRESINTAKSGPLTPHRSPLVTLSQVAEPINEYQNKIDNSHLLEATDPSDDE